MVKRSRLFSFWGRGMACHAPTCSQERTISHTLISMPPAPLVTLGKNIGVVFLDKNLLVEALTHRSAVRRSGLKKHNERFEFLGDAVLELVATEYLFRVSDKPEGELTNYRSALVKGEHLAFVAQEMNLGAYLHLSRGEEASGGREKPSTLAKALEALIGRSEERPV